MKEIFLSEVARLGGMALEVVESHAEEMGHACGEGSSRKVPVDMALKILALGWSREAEETREWLLRERKRRREPTQRYHEQVGREVYGLHTHNPPPAAVQGWLE